MSRIDDLIEERDGLLDQLPTKPLTLEERIKAKLSYLNGDTKVTEVSTTVFDGNGLKFVLPLSP